MFAVRCVLFVDRRSSRVVACLSFVVGYELFRSCCCGLCNTLFGVWCLLVGVC